MLVVANIFQPLIDVFQSVLNFFHNSVGVSWGFSIILLTVCVRLVLMPLTVKQFHGMRKLQQHAPEIAAIKERYKNDKQRQQQETMKLYSDNGVNPLASCLPMVAQLPVFISLFYMLRENLRYDICRPIQTRYQTAFAHNLVTTTHISAHAAHLASLGQTTWCTYYGNRWPAASFLFIKDITDQARGATLVVLILLYVGTQMASSLLMSAPTMDKNQRRMMTFLPVIFVLFIIRFPAGLLIYWITTNTWTMTQQFTLKRVIGAPMIPETIDVVSTGNSSSRSNGSKSGASLTGSSNTSSRSSGPSRISSLFTPKAPDQNGKSSKGESANGNGVATKSSGPPPSSRKKKKRSGRRR